MIKSSFSMPRRGASAFLGCVVAVLLAGCADENAAPAAANETQASQSQTQSSTAQSTAPQNGTAATRINIKQCAQPVGDKVFFKIGGAQLGVPGGVIVEAIPSALRPPIKKEDATRELERQAANGGGCPERPLDTVLLIINERFAHPLLEGTAGLVRAAPGATAQFAELTRQLQQKPTQNCRQLNGELLACVGTETRGNRETPVMYVITTNKSQNLNTGGPLAARCTLQDKKVEGCKLIDTLPGGLTIDVTLNAGTYTTADLAGARNAALQQINSYVN